MMSSKKSVGTIVIKKRGREGCGASVKLGGIVVSMATCIP